MRRITPLTGLCVLAVSLAIPGAASAAGTFDGTYRGSQVTSRSNESSACRNMNHDHVVVTVTDNVVTRKWGGGKYGGDTITARVAPDGSFKNTVMSSNAGKKGYADSYFLEGQIAGGVMQAEIGSNLCAVKMTLNRS